MNRFLRKSFLEHQATICFIFLIGLCNARFRTYKDNKLPPRQPVHRCFEDVECVIPCGPGFEAINVSTTSSENSSIVEQFYPVYWIMETTHVSREVEPVPFDNKHYFWGSNGSLKINATRVSPRDLDTGMSHFACLEWDSQPDESRDRVITRSTVLFSRPTKFVMAEPVNVTEYVRECTEFEFRCEFDGIPVPRVEWLKHYENGSSEIVAYDRRGTWKEGSIGLSISYETHRHYTGEMNLVSVLHLTVPEPKESGIYQCRVFSNGVDKNQTEPFLGPKNHFLVTTRPGAPAPPPYFEFLVYGPEKVVYKWKMPPELKAFSLGHVYYQSALEYHEFPLVFVAVRGTEYIFRDEPRFENQWNVSFIGSISWAGQVEDPTRPIRFAESRQSETVTFRFPTKEDYDRRRFQRIFRSPSHPLYTEIPTENDFYIPEERRLADMRDRDSDQDPDRFKPVKLGHIGEDGKFVPYIPPSTESEYATTQAVSPPAAMEDSPADVEEEEAESPEEESELESSEEESGEFGDAAAQNASDVRTLTPSVALSSSTEILKGGFTREMAVVISGVVCGLGLIFLSALFVGLLVLRQKRRRDCPRSETVADRECEEARQDCVAPPQPKMLTEVTAA